MINFCIAKDFTDAPGGRFKRDGKYSAEELYEDILKDKLSLAFYNKEEILLDFDGSYGYAGSFIDELFFRIKRDSKKEDILNYLKIKSDEDLDLILEIQKNFLECYGEEIKILLDTIVWRSK
jgi:hypothetical protein